MVRWCVLCMQTFRLEFVTLRIVNRRDRNVHEFEFRQFSTPMSDLADEKDIKSWQHWKVPTTALHWLGQGRKISSAFNGWSPNHHCFDTKVCVLWFVGPDLDTAAQLWVNRQHTIAQSDEFFITAFYFRYSVFRFMPATPSLWLWQHRHSWNFTTAFNLWKIPYVWLMTHTMYSADSNPKILTKIMKGL